MSPPLLCQARCQPRTSPASSADLAVERQRERASHATVAYSGPAVLRRSTLVPSLERSPFTSSLKEVVELLLFFRLVQLFECRRSLAMSESPTIVLHSSRTRSMY